jgi:hypothetical protein
MVLTGVLLALLATSPVPAQAGSSLDDLDLAQSRAARLKQPLLVLVAESGASRNDDRTRALVDSLAAKALRDKCAVLNLDLAISRTRATAGRFHVTNTPTLFCLSPRGIIISRDDRAITRDLVLQRVEEARQQSPILDAQLASLEAAIDAPTNNATAIFNLTDFLLARHNDLETIPRLEAIAHSNAYPPNARARAWVALVSAHFWIAEPEKGRHEANDLLATLGPRLPEAKAAGMLLLGEQDATAKRTSLAREELEQALAAAPESSYGQAAARALAALPGKRDAK